MKTVVLVKVTCPKCSRRLVDAPVGARVMCPRCGRWIQAR